MSTIINECPSPTVLVVPEDCSAPAEPLPEPIAQSLYACICAMGIERKVIDIAIAEKKIPPELKADAAQEIRIAWHKAKAKAEYTFGETASYAHRIACNAALKVRRDLGSSMRLPGSAFRKKKDGSTHVNPGILAAAVDISEVEDRLIYGESDSTTVISSQDLQAMQHRVTPRQAEIIALMVEGYSFAEIQIKLSLKKSSMQRQITAIRALGAK